MKQKIERNTKTALVGLLIAFILILSYGIFFLISYPGTKEEKVFLYRYTHQANATYNVGLKPNTLYESPVLNEGQVYLAPLVDKINASFNYQFKGERTADLKGDYEIIGIVEGYQGEKDTYKTLWTKRYVLQANTPFTAKNNVFTISNQIPVDFNSYRTFTDNLAKDLNVSFNSKLTVMMNVHIQATMDKGPLEETLSPGLVIPLNSQFVEITKIQTGDKPGAIQRTDKTKAPVNKPLVLGCCIVLAITVVSLIYLVFFISGTASKNSAEKKKLSEIFKKHGSRMVAMTAGAPEVVGSKYQINTMDDLVKLSDETGRPIMYEYQMDVKNITQFYIMDQNVFYYWNTEADATYSNIDRSVIGGASHGQSES